ncbi:hypothetical protein [Erwinia sp. AnSW2-5]
MPLLTTAVAADITVVVDITAGITVGIIMVVVDRDAADKNL